MGKTGDRTQNLRRLIIESGLRLLEEGLVTRTFGNVSIRLDENTMLITPSGRRYDELGEKDIVKVNYLTGEFEGIIKPSSEFKLHAEVYKNREEINAVIHTHQQNASTIAATRRTLPTILDDQAQLIGAGVKVAKYAHSSSPELVENVVEALGGRTAALIANHGAVCIGRNIEEAFVVSQVLEKACKSFIEASFVGGAKSIDKFDAQKMHKEYIEKYSVEAEKNK
jgi:L-fuculose-phosphate aldolase